MKKSIAGEARRQKSLDKKARAATKTSDSFQNFAAGLGIGTDNLTSASTYGFNPITRVRILLEWIYRGSWLGGIAVDVVAEDMTRAGITLKGDIEPEDAEKIEALAVELKIWEKIAESISWGRLYGGAVALFLIDGQKVNTPFRIKTVGQDQFKGLYVMDRWQLEPTLFNVVTDLGPELGKPKFYKVVNSSLPFSGQDLHYSRVIRMGGIKLPIWQAMTENMWDISVLERLYDRMVAFDSASSGAAQLVYKSYIRTYKIKDFRENVGQGGPALQGLLKYVDMMRRYQSIEGVTLLDAEDEFEAQAHTAFSGLSDALLQFGQQLAGALQIPLVRLFGQSPAGLNATGESDLRMYYDGINQSQNADLKIPVTTIYRCLAQSLGIKLPDNFGIEFNPLWQLTEEQKATIASTTTETVGKGVEQGLVNQQVALKELKQSAEITGIWSNITDEDIEAAEEELPPGPGEMHEAEQEMQMEQTSQPAPARGGALRPKGKTNDSVIRSTEELLSKAATYVRSKTLRVSDPFSKFKNEAFFTAQVKAFGNVTYYQTPKSDGAKIIGYVNTFTHEGEFDESGISFSIIRQSVENSTKSKDSIRSVSGVTYFHDLHPVIENPKGSIRRGGVNGSSWQATMAADYGYLQRTEDADGDQLDIFIGDFPESDKVFVIDQKKQGTEEFDEHKCVLGVYTGEEALDIYRKSYDRDPSELILKMTEVPMNEFKFWMQNGNLSEPYASRT